MRTKILSAGFDDGMNRIRQAIYDVFEDGSGNHYVLPYGDQSLKDEQGKLYECRIYFDFSQAKLLPDRTDIWTLPHPSILHLKDSILVER